MPLAPMPGGWIYPVEMPRSHPLLQSSLRFPRKALRRSPQSRCLLPCSQPRRPATERSNPFPQRRRMCGWGECIRRILGQQSRKSQKGNQKRQRGPRRTRSESLSRIERYHGQDRLQCLLLRQILALPSPQAFPHLPLRPLRQIVYPQPGRKRRSPPRRLHTTGSLCRESFQTARYAQRRRAEKRLLRQRHGRVLLEKKRKFFRTRYGIPGRSVPTRTLLRSAGRPAQPQCRLGHRSCSIPSPLASVPHRARTSPASFPLRCSVSPLRVPRRPLRCPRRTRWRTAPGGHHLTGWILPQRHS